MVFNILLRFLNCLAKVCHGFKMSNGFDRVLNCFGLVLNCFPEVLIALAKCFLFPWLLMVLLRLL